MEETILNDKSLKGLIETLQSALKTGYSLSSFPAQPLLELMIDASLQLGNLAEEGGPWTEVSNPSLEFLEKPLRLRSGRLSGIRATIPDLLGNVAQKRRKPAVQMMTDPKLPKFFKELASTLVQIKQTRKLPTHLYCEEGERRRDQPVKKITPNAYWYLKRRKDRLKKKQKNHNRKG